MPTKITYFVHGTTFDNEQKLASGQNEVDLSELGIQQGKDLGQQRTDAFDLIICSDLSRAIDTANLAFEGRCEIQIDPRLRECDYGDLSQKPKTWDINNYINSPYPNGESYQDVQKRIQSLLDELKVKHPNKHIAFVAHHAPQLALNVILKGQSWEETIKNDWRKTKNWQPGWEYILG